MATLTVGDTNPRVQYTATSGQTVFAYGFPIFADADLKVYVGSTLKTLTTDYTVSGAATTSGGNVTFGSGLTAGDIVTIYRDLAVARASDYQTGGDLLAETLNDDLDKLVMMVQQSEADVANRSIRFGQFVTGLPLSEITDNATARANKVIGFDSSGQPIATTEIGNFQGDWAASTAYVTRDIIKDTSNNNIYIANESHTSSGSQPISSNTDSGKWDLLVDAASATTSATNAASSATAAASSATAAASSATSAASSATTATTQASTATTQASNAATSATAAATAQAAAEAALDNFDDVYLGAKASDPTLDNDGDALTAGDMYFSTATDRMRVYSGSSWADVALDSATVVSKTSTTGSGQLPSGTTAQRDGSPSAGYIRFNSTDGSFEGYDGSAWGAIGGADPTEVLTNKISPSSGTSFTFGDSGDTFTVPSGAEIDIASGATLDVNGTIDVTGATTTGFPQGGLQHITTVETTTDSSSIDIQGCFSSTYTNYLVVMNNIMPVTNSTDVWLQLGNSDLTTIRGSYQYVLAHYSGSATGPYTYSANGTATGIMLANNMSNNILYGVNLSIWFYNPYSSSTYTAFHGGGEAFDNLANWANTFLCTGSSRTNDQDESLRIKANSGNIDGNTLNRVTVYGLAES